MRGQNLNTMKPKKDDRDSVMVWRGSSADFQPRVNRNFIPLQTSTQHRTNMHLLS